jgi:hypothetical protein
MLRMQGVCMSLIGAQATRLLFDVVIEFHGNVITMKRIGVSEGSRTLSPQDHSLML